MQKAFASQISFSPSALKNSFYGLINVGISPYQSVLPYSLIPITVLPHLFFNHAGFIAKQFSVKIVISVQLFLRIEYRIG